MTSVVRPLLLAGPGVYGEQARIGGGHVHDAVMDQRLRLLPALLFATERKGPGGKDVLHVVLVDLVQRAEALLVAAHAVGNDLRGGGLVIGQIMLAHAGMSRMRRGQCNRGRT